MKFVNLTKDIFQGKIIKINDERVQLAEVTAIILETCLTILGLKTVFKI